MNMYAVRCMERAKYFCTGSEPDTTKWQHYALSVSHYTHFTSPIRRYADVVVHRLLQWSIEQVSAPFDQSACEAWAAQCNLKKERAKEAQERSAMLFLCFHLEAQARKCGKTGMDEGSETDAFILQVQGIQFFSGLKFDGQMLIPTQQIEPSIF